MTKIATAVEEMKQEFSYLISLEGINLKEDDTKKWIHAMPLGEYNHPRYGKIKITRKRAKRFADNVKAGVRGQQLDIDYDHKKSAQGGKAAAWVVDAKSTNNGLWLLVEFTAPAAEAVRNKEYKYFSPEFVDKWTHPKTGEQYEDVLFGGALTNRPFLKDILPINLSEFEAPDGKWSQEDTHYRTASDTMRRCLNCAFFRAEAPTGEPPQDEPPEDESEEYHEEGKPGSCLVVDGEIDADYLCDHFKAVYSSSSMMPFTEGGENVDWLDDPEVAKIYREIPPEERKKAQGTSFAGKNRSFPILKPEDVAAAASSLGRAGDDNYDTETLKRNIIRIAKSKGEAFVAKLPASWKKELEEVNMEEFLKQLCEAHGITEPEELTEANVLAAISKKLSEQPKPVTTTEEDEKARKFAEDYPEEAAQLAEQQRTIKLNEINANIKEWEGSGLPPKFEEPIRELRLTLSDEQSEKFDSIVSELVKDGLVEVSEKGSGSGEAAELTERFEAEVKKLMDEDKDLSYKDAISKVSADNPELAKAWVKEGSK